MKHTTTVIIPAKIIQEVDKTTCDLCNEEIQYKRYSADEVVIKRRTGDSYPEGGSGEEVEVDMCGDCFDKKLIPWLKSQGVTPAIEEWDNY